VAPGTGSHASATTEPANRVTRRFAGAGTAPGVRTTRTAMRCPPTVMTASLVRRTWNWTVRLDRASTRT
jgi:hypothetical protein